MVNNSVNVLALLLVLMLKALTKIVGYNESELNGSEQCKEKWHLSAKMPLHEEQTDSRTRDRCCMLTTRCHWCSNLLEV